MLTATYSLVALSVEQKNARCGLSALEYYIKSAKHIHEIDPVRLGYALDKLAQFEQYCHERKVALYIIPAIRKATTEADCLLAELESLSSTGIDILQSIRNELYHGFEQNKAKVEEMCKSIEMYCTNLYQRLLKEEELFRIAQRVISVEEWFGIAASFLSYDAKKRQASVRR